MSELKYSKEQIIDACKEAGLGILECNSLITVLGCCHPEATKPAQDLGAAILAMNRAKLLPIWDNDVPHKLHVELDVIFKALAALASPADALVAGDSKTAKDADVCIKPEAYLVTWQNGKRRTLAFNHWIPGQPEDSTVIPLARYGVEAVEEAFELAAKTIELFDDKTMECDYMLDATECAGIIRALKPSAIAAIQAQKDGHG